MAHLIRDEGIVLHSLRHGETSRIVRVLLRERGKISMISKGARSKKGGVGAALEPFSRCEFLYYDKASREVQLLKEVSILNAHEGLRKNLPHLTVASALTELCQMTLKEHDSHPEIYDGLETSLVSLDAAPKNPLPFLWKFELGLFAALGFALSLDACAGCGKELKPPFDRPVKFRYEDGCFFEPKCTSASNTDGSLSAVAFATLLYIAQRPASAIGNVMFPPKRRGELQNFLSKYLSYHLPVRGHLKSLEALRWSDKEN